MQISKLITKSLSDRNFAINAGDSSIIDCESLQAEVYTKARVIPDDNMVIA